MVGLATTPLRRLEINPPYRFPPVFHGPVNVERMMKWPPRRVL